MRKFQVKSLSVSGLGKKIFRCGQIVKETDFPPGNADILVKERHLIEVESDHEPTVSNTVIPVLTVNSDTPDDSLNDDENKNIEVKTPVADSLMNAFDSEEKQPEQGQNNGKKNKKK